MVEPIAIIGSACRFPGGADSPSKLWSLIHEPHDLSRKPLSSRFDIDSFYHPVGTHHGTTNAKKSYWLEDEGRSNVRQFDAAFFNIQPAEADAMDPQQRLLMEVVYETLCAAGQPMERLRGSDTSVYVGSMCDDYNTMLTRDWETLPRYTATGLEKGILANRVSYFFDWHGASLSLDTACSSSLVALDHAVQTIRTGRSKVAVAAGTSLILSPAMYISESNLGMLSPNGRCAMWDVAADGYARGEGVAAVMLKTLSQALADNDPIECIIRETLVNQDGRTSGLTVPSNTAQTALIKECYANVGLDPINNPQDRPQYFHAHGTGTQAGDPQEAEAISNALFPADMPTKTTDKLLVGSIKTVIGHTEGTAGLASIIGTSMALKHAIVPPNLHFENLSPKVAPFFDHLEIPTAPTPWPTEQGQTMRASVNSFGFGGTNAHCILEAYVPKFEDEKSPSKLFSPLVFSATSEWALKTTLSGYLEYMKANPSLNLRHLAYTLQDRRSTFPFRKAIAAGTVTDAIYALEDVKKPSSKDQDNAALGTRYRTLAEPAKIFGIFTGQGAQWPRMGAELIESSPFFDSRIAELDAILQSLPDEADRPEWTIRNELLASQETSRIAEAAISQPLCTAVQVVLVDVLRRAGISFAAVVGHSSGEIGAAYAAGLVTWQDAIRIAYFRGVHAKLASSPQSHGPRGAMMAVGMSFKEASILCRADQFVGRIQVAAVNSTSSATLSGDEDAVDEVEQLLKDQGTFARKLKVDTAYHSAHMGSCAGPYLASLNGSGVGLESPVSNANTTVWFSSVHEDHPMTKDKLTNQYWVDNMCNPVLFADAVSQALQKSAMFDLAIEVGPHPALKGPAMATINDFSTGESIPYTGLLSRNKDDVAQLAMGLGIVWTQLGSSSVALSTVETSLSGVESNKVLTNLPLYPFDHQRSYWTSSRIANHFKHRNPDFVTNPVLGNPCSEATTPGEVQWRKILQPSEMPWLKGHMLQGQTVFPATGYVSMAIEAIKTLVLDAKSDSTIGLIKLADVDIGRAIAFDHDSTTVEVIFSVSSVAVSDSFVKAEWACYSAGEGAATVSLNAKGQVLAEIFPAQPNTLALVETDTFGLVDIDTENFYDNLSGIGYGYSPPFRGLSNIRRKLGYSVGTLSDDSGSGWDDNLVLHPGMLDSALQTAFAAWSYPGDTAIWSLHVPVSISAITINTCFTPLGSRGKQASLRYETFIRSKEPAKVVGDIYVSTSDGSHVFLQMEGATLVPFSRATPKDDLPMFSHFQYKIASPDGNLAAEGETMSGFQTQMYKDVDRVAFWFLRNASLSFSAEERQALLPHFQKYLQWCDRMVEMVARNAHPKVKAECNADSRETIDHILSPYEGRKDIRFVQVVGENLIPVIRAGTSMLEHMNQDGLLRAFYEDEAICSGPTGRWLSRVVKQISHRFPALNIFEVGAGTGATTSAVLKELGGTYASYTFTDISSAFFLPAEERFGAEAKRMDFKTYNMEKDPAGQGFVPGSYDVVVAVNVLHVSGDMEVSLSSVRRLLKPGGFLVVAELTSTDLLFSGMTVGTLPGWWIGAETGRPWGPLFTLNQWDSVLKKTGFAGVDTVTPDISASLPMSVFVAQAVDDRVTLLRNPLSVQERPAGVRNSGFAVIGGITPAVRKSGQRIIEQLSHRFQNKHLFNTMEDFAASDLAKTASSEPVSVLCLTDLDEPYLEDLTAAKFDALKTLWAVGGTVVWVTSKDVPYSHMMTGIVRTVSTENPNLNVQLFDVDLVPGSDDPFSTRLQSDVAVTMLRQHILHEWGTDSDSLLWTAEPEVYLRNGTQLIARLLPNVEKNDRYNSQRREVFTTVRPGTDTLELQGTGEGQKHALELCKVTPLKSNPAPTAGYRSVQLKYSLLQSLAVAGAGMLRLCVGNDVETGEALLALSGTSESPAVVPASWCIPATITPSPSTLVAIAASLTAEYILSLTPQSGTLLVNEPDLSLQTALRTKASAKHANLVFTTSKLSQQSGGDDLVFLHPNFPHHTTRAAIPAVVAVFVHCSRGPKSDAVGRIISRLIPTSCLRLDEEAIFGHKVTAGFQVDSPVDLTAVLHKALDDAPSTGLSAVETVDLASVHCHTAVGEPLAVVDWTSAQSVTAKVRPIDSATLFRADRTYLFVGMAGELGQSLAEWMIAHGARTVVLTSRNPKVSPRFIERMDRQYNAAVKTMALDITSRRSLRDVLSTIDVALPRLGGVMNGAMILRDDLFSNMSHDNFARVTAPKVLGTRLLDEAFHDDASLDYFIVASSIASVIGWTGQSNYSAANEYMTSLVSNRRKRGVPGSIINIPAVLGVGYAAHADNFDFDYFQSLGHINIGEEDLHTLFAEAILSGRPQGDLDSKAQVAMGVNFVAADLEVKAAHKRDAKFGHFTKHEDKAADVGAAKATVHVKVQLQSAKDAEEAYDVTRDAFVAHLKRMLRLTADDKVDDTSSLVDQGIDSLVAVDIRRWFLKELGVDVPTLKILGGGSIADLIHVALEKMPELTGGTTSPEQSDTTGSMSPTTGETTGSSPARSESRSSAADPSSDAVSTTSRSSENSDEYAVDEAKAMLQGKEKTEAPVET